SGVLGRTARLNMEVGRGVDENRRWAVGDVAGGYVRKLGAGVARPTAEVRAVPSDGRGRARRYQIILEKIGHIDLRPVHLPHAPGAVHNVIAEDVAGRGAGRRSLAY